MIPLKDYGWAFLHLKILRLCNKDLSDRTFIVLLLTYELINVLLPKIVFLPLRLSHKIKYFLMEAASNQEWPYWCAYTTLDPTIHIVKRVEISNLQNSSFFKKLDSIICKSNAMALPSTMVLSYISKPKPKFCLWQYGQNHWCGILNGKSPLK